MSSSQSRPAFTLIELLVVMALMAVMAGFAILFFPNAASSAREARAATNLQGWLNIAKQRAMRDQAPRGLRLWVTSTTVNGVTIPNVVTDCQYIEQPDDFSGGRIFTPLPANLSQLQIDFGTTGSDLTNGYIVNPAPDPTQKFWAVQPGDYLEVLGSGLMHRIIAITSPATFVVTPPLATPINVNVRSANYRILRAPRPIGDELLKMPSDTVIDLNPNVGLVDTAGLVVPTVATPNLTSGNPNPLPPIANVMNEGGGFVDILFAPNGSVISRGVATKNIHLWVRVPHQEVPANVFRGDPTLVSVFVRTGLVGAYPPARTGDPYALVK